MADWVIKSISITAEDAKTVQKIGNLSKFVRECLRRWALHEQTSVMLHRQPGIQERLGVCLPRSLCPVCWPDGVPTEHHFAMWRGSDPQSLNETQLSLSGQINNSPAPYHGPEVGNIEWLRSTIGQPFDISDIEHTGNEKPKKTKKDQAQKSIISRMLNFLHK